MATRVPMWITARHRFHTRFDVRLRRMFITLSIDAEVIQLKAEHDLSKIGFSRQELSKSATATAVLRRSGKENGEDVAG